MSCTINKINVYRDNLIEMLVTCDNCKKENVHTIGHASTIYKDKVVIDFSKLGKRCCDGYYENKCIVDYALYK